MDIDRFLWKEQSNVHHCGHEENVDLEDFMYDESSYGKRKWYGTGSCVQL